MIYRRFAMALAFCFGAFVGSARGAESPQGGFQSRRMSIRISMNIGT